MFLLSVSVTHIEWFDEEKEFAIAFIDGVVKLGRKNPNFQPISLSAHQVSQLLTVCVSRMHTVELSSEHSHQQDRQCMCNITMKCVHITMVAVGKQVVLCIMNVCLYSCLSYLACKLHVFCAILYCHLWPV